MNPDIHGLLGAYVLDAVDDVERMAFERHLRECSECRTEVAELREVTSRLADGAWSVPPPSLRTNVMTTIRATRQLSPETPAARPARSGVPRWRRLTAAAAAVIAVGGATYAVQDQRVRREHNRAEAAQAAEARVRSVLAAPDLVVREQVVDGGGRVTVAVSRLRNSGVIMLAADSVPADHVYQLWTVRSGKPVSEGALATGQSAAVRIVDGIDQASAVGVTVEPPGGSATPTLPMVAAVKLV
jgi:anti-sigma-K factor RskA